MATVCDPQTANDDDQPRRKTKRAKRDLEPTGRLPATSKATTRVQPSDKLPKKKAKPTTEPNSPLSSLVADIRELQRQRVATQKSRIMIDNRLTATVATANGYHASMEDEERGKRFGDAKKLIREVQGECNCETHQGRALTSLIQAASVSVVGFHTMEKAYEKEMEKLAKQLPVARWQQLTDQRGFGLLSLAIIIGEAGDLSNYDNPGKLWKRMGCAPFESKGKMLMPSTWSSRKKENGGLSSAEWVEVGYCPRRRSVVYVLVDSLMKGNGVRKATDTKPAMPAGPYTRRYQKKKQEAIDRNDPEWTPGCKACKGSGDNKSGGKCSDCSGRGYMVMRPHLHGLLLAGKLLLRELWIEWRLVVDGIEPEPWSG